MTCNHCSKQSRTLLLISLAACFGATVAIEATPAKAANAETAASAAAVRSLWLGSSSAYFHDIPAQTAEWLTTYAKTTAISHLVGRSGTAIYKYLAPDFKAEYRLEKGQTLLDKIRTGRYSFVVLQIPTDFLAGRQGNDRDAFLAGMETLVRASRDAALL